MRRFSQFKAFKIINGYRKSTDEKHCGNCDYFIVTEIATILLSGKWEIDISNVRLWVKQRRRRQI